MGYVKCCVIHQWHFAYLKAGLNAADDGLAGVQQLAGDATIAILFNRRGPRGS